MSPVQSPRARRMSCASSLAMGRSSYDLYSAATLSYCAFSDVSMVDGELNILCEVSERAWLGRYLKSEPEILWVPFDRNVGEG
jgi:hypothetical protein